jgi:GH15 family glucan-1,4-alpha-glucosidase
MSQRRRVPISGHGAIGNLRSVALLSSEGSVTWCCFPHLSSPSVFAALLDPERGGHFKVSPVEEVPGELAYLEDTNVLVTRWRGSTGLLEVTDFMPLEGPLEGEAATPGPAELHRLVRCLGGRVEVRVEWAPRLDYARAATHLEPILGGYTALAGGLALGLGHVPGRVQILDTPLGPVLRSDLWLEQGESFALITRWGPGAPPCSWARSARALETTARAWRGWLAAADAWDRPWAGRWSGLVRRSELALKLLTYAETGAIAAAATTSLPESLGGVRNWDYRYAWIRDAGLTAQALLALGHQWEASRFLNWVEMAASAGERAGRALQIMYGLHGELDLPEGELSHLRGYAGSTPVRIGNAAASQRQHDIHGELLTAAYELDRVEGRLPPELVEFLTKSADEAARMWSETDSGIWEVRAEERHYVHSKLLCWAALDRAIRLTSAGFLPSSRRPYWEAERSRLFRALLRHGYDPEEGAFVQSFGSKVLDASNLLIPIHELLPGDDPRVLGTLQRTVEELTHAGLVYRYRADDGLPGEEGAFGLTTFWLVDALVLAGEQERAWEIYEGLARRATPLGLFSEQIDPSSGEFLGNYPQAFTHLGLINSALYLAYGEGARLPVPPLLGTPEHRRERPPPLLYPGPHPRQGVVRPGTIFG